MLLPPNALVGDWRVQRLLGRGTYSEVYVGVHAVSGALCALKVDKPQAGSRPGDALRKEADVLSRLQAYPCVPRFYGLLTYAAAPSPGSAPPPPPPVPVLAEGASMLTRSAAGAPHDAALSVASTVAPSAASASATSKPEAKGTL